MIRSRPASYEVTPPQDTLDRARHGDRDAFGELYRAFEPRLQRYCLSRLRNPTEADDAVSETFLRALTALPRLGDRVPFFPWLQVICRNVCTDVQRHYFRETGKANPVTITGQSAEDSVIASIGIATAKEAISRLSDAERSVFALRSSLGLSSAEIASVTNLSPATVDRSVYRTRQFLRSELQSILSAAVFGGIFELRSRLSLLRSWTFNRANGLAGFGPQSPLPVGRVFSYVAIAGILAGGGTLVATHDGRSSVLSKSPSTSLSLAALSTSTKDEFQQGPPETSFGRTPSALINANESVVNTGAISTSSAGNSPAVQTTVQATSTNTQRSAATLNTPARSPSFISPQALTSSSGSVDASAASTAIALGTIVKQTVHRTRSLINSVAHSTTSLHSTASQTKTVTDQLTQTVVQAANVVQQADSFVTQMLPQTVAAALPPLAPSTSSSTSTATTTATTSVAQTLTQTLSADGGHR